MNGNSGLDIKDVSPESKVEEKKEVVIEKTKEEKQRENSLAIFSQSDEAIEIANKMLEGFEIKLKDEKTRPQLTGPTGATIGTIVNMGLDSLAEDDPDKKAHLREISLTSAAEVGVATLKTLFAGNRRLRSSGKKIIKHRR